MNLFLSNDIRTFLKAVDSGLNRPFEIEIIGGAAASLAFRANSGTEDIDSLTTLASIQMAIDAARVTTGLEIEMSTVSVSEVPYNYAKRLKRVRIRGMKKLRILVPEKHDWALMKIARFYGKDIEDIKEVNEKVGFSRHTFMRRFLSEMTHVGTPRDFTFSFLAMMQELFGIKEAHRMGKAINKHKNWNGILVT